MFTKEYICFPLSCRTNPVSVLFEVCDAGRSLGLSSMELVDNEGFVYQVKGCSMLAKFSG